MRLRAVVGLLVVVASFVACGAPPGVIRDEMATTSRVKSGAATIVFFTDFQCPYCRKTHAALAPIVEARRDRLRVVVRHVPLPRHPDARTAARAAVCVEALTPALLDDYTHALFEAPDLSEAACEALAIERGVDRERFRRCLADAATDARVERDLAMFDAVRGDGVPLLYVGRTRIDGAPSRSSLEAAVDDAIAGN
ncbi:MAG: thioredoxin domain-containing protein [Labilithrix sp.]|nr:thioredoxin domain-containing protein [Labilithrix sp.]MCW5835475.1 thioredoxin domain-containing protein [Labilithrix sp.]